MKAVLEAGCDDVGIGALFGLYDWRFEVLGLVSHALYLQQRILPLAVERKIAFIAGPPDHPDAVQRLSGYKAALAANRIPYAPKLVAPGDYTEAGGLAAMGRLLNNTPGTSDASMQWSALQADSLSSITSSVMSPSTVFHEARKSRL